MNWTPEAPFQALALTGGGYRGLFTARALQVMEAHLKAPIGRRFDLTCGTSIGGIVALAVAFEVPMARVVKIFTEYGEAIFPPHNPPTSILGQMVDLYRYSRKPRYDTSPLREAVTKLIPAKATLGDALHPVAIPAVNVTEGKHQVFKTRHKAEWCRDWKFKAVDVALATAAAPTFFELAEVGTNVYADGGLFANAPDLIAIHEAEHFFDVPKEAIRVLSIGTTTQTYSIASSAGRRFGILDWMTSQRLFSVIISSQQQFVDQLVKHRLGDSYVRIDHPATDEQARDLGLDVSHNRRTKDPHRPCRQVRDRCAGNRADAVPSPQAATRNSHGALMGRAARLFNGAAEQTLHGRVTPTVEQREFLKTQWNTLAEHLKKELAGWGYPISTWLQGSYKYGTLIKPVHKGEEYDVDVGLYFEWDPEEVGASPAPEQLREWVQQELLEYKKTHADVKRIDEPPKERCSRAVYGKQFHIDTPTYHLNIDTDERRLACLSGKWENSDPKALYKWFRDAVGTDDRDLLRRIIRYLKGWAAVAFAEAPDARPSSIVLTVLATEAFQDMWAVRLLGIADDDALVAVVEAIYDRLAADREVRNPIDDSEDLNRIPEKAWDTFFTRLTVLQDAAQAANGTEDEAAAALAWTQAFAFLMPLPETDEVEVVDHSSGRALMQIPEIRVQIFDKKDGNLQSTHMNEVPSVGRNRYLTFTIVNGQVVPAFSTVEWTVRNDGLEADDLGDLGHTRGGIGLLSVDEHTAYIGKHYMDCVIRSNGTVFAARRIPVTVKLDPRPLLAQAKRNWIRLRTRRGRRR